MISKIEKALDNNSFILMQGAVVEILRRMNNVTFHPDLIHTHLIYDNKGANELASVFNSYINIAKRKDLQYIMCAPTWRANKENVKKSGIKASINIDAVQFINKLRTDSGDFSKKIIIGGTIGPKNDCYTPSLSLSREDAEEFHTWQIAELVKGGADFIIAETIPNIQEALGIANAASKLNTDYIISFVISRDGKILDNTSLLDAINEIDNSVDKPPVGYAVNCAHPSFICADEQPKEIFNRLIAFIGNASSLDHCDLEDSGSLHMDNVLDWGEEMLRLNSEFGIKILGGCCGTDSKHIEYLTKDY